jgi:CRISPR/Cas system-associated endoribonuclease Cas2
MAYYVITYDIRDRPGHDYQPLYDQLASWNAAHLQNSVWLADLNGTAVQVRDTLRSHMHNDDTFCVLRVFHNSKWATWNARKTATDWLKAHMDQQ